MIGLMMRLLLSVLALLAAGVAPVCAQEPLSAAADTAWNSPRALELIHRAQARRAAANADSGLSSYRADARIYVYFYLDRRDTGERNLVKTDQLALEVFWQSPDQTKQRIVGWRDEKSLPTNIRYHLDHLTVVQENFGDEIRLGDGDEVIGVVHPAAPGAEEVYEYRLADSLTLRLPGAPEPVRVYELQVRPRDLSSPGFVGSVFVDRRAGDIVRMDFTFTASSYVDRYLDYINISLDNGLWQGRYWLPNQQRVEIRRRIPELDIPAGSVIRANMRISNYRFDEPMPPGFFAGDPVVALPRAQREAFPFEQDIHAEVREEGIGPQAELSEIRALATELLREEALRRSAKLRLQVGGASDVLRHNRAEGLVLAAGAVMSPVPGLRAAGRAGWAFGPSHAPASLTLSSLAGPTTVSLELYRRTPRDLGVGPVGSGAMNTLASVLAGKDYTDLFYATGAALSLRYPLPPNWQVAVTGRAERHRSAALTSDFSVFGEPRPVRSIDPTDLMLAGRVELERIPGAESKRWLAVKLAADFGRMEPLTGSTADELGVEPAYLKPTAQLEWGRRWLARDAELRMRLSAGAAFGDLPVQEVYLLGGKGTIPGYPFRRYAGEQFFAAGAEYAWSLWQPWIRGRLLGAVGWSAFPGGESSLQARVAAPETGNVLPSLGVGVGLFHDILRVDVARGLGSSGEWELIVEANPGFWDFL